MASKNKTTKFTSTKTKECKHSVVFEQDDYEANPIIRTAYISKQWLEANGNPEKVSLTITPA